MLLQLAFELPIVAGWIVALAFCARTVSLRRLLWPLLVGTLVAVALEVANERRGNLTVYDAPYLLRCVPYHFPLAIVCGGGMYSAALCALADRLSGRLRTRPAALFWVFWLVLTPSAMAIEAIGIQLGLWRWVVPRPWSLDFALGVWKYYLLFLAPGALAFRLARRREVPRSDPA